MSTTAGPSSSTTPKTRPRPHGTNYSEAPSEQIINVLIPTMQSLYQFPWQSSLTRRSCELAYHDVQKHLAMHTSAQQTHPDIGLTRPVAIHLKQSITQYMQYSQHRQTRSGFAFIHLHSPKPSSRKSDAHGPRLSPTHTIRPD